MQLIFSYHALYGFWARHVRLFVISGAVSRALAVKMPLPPGFMTTLYNNDARYEEAYLAQFPGYYSAVSHAVNSI